MGQRLFFISLMSVIYVGCGGSGGGGGNASNTGTPTTRLFENDMNLLNNDSQFSAKATDTQMNGAITKVFGGTESRNVHRFISERVKYVYSFDEIFGFNIDVFSNNQKVYSGTLKSMAGEEENDSGPLNIAGANIGAGLAIAEYSENLEIKIHLPTGAMDIGSLRLGLVALTKYYSVIPTQDGKEISVPLDGRVSVLVHEGRHSDCPSGFSSDNCGFMHRKCTSGPAAGYPACDNSYWGPYALGGLYLKSALAKYRSSSMDYRIIQALMDDSFSRLTENQMDALYTTTPELNSF
ncbi:hypothetical protein K2X05_13015 [bacterium]|nr:hypothetical protein [bacterium]